MEFKSPLQQKEKITKNILIIYAIHSNKKIKNFFFCKTSLLAKVRFFVFYF